jgi:hypothetical protein
VVYQQQHVRVLLAARLFKPLLNLGRRGHQIVVDP